VPDAAIAPPGLVGWACGFYGKLPSHGDFVRAGLPRGFVRAWDEWAARVLSASRDRLGHAWLSAWLEAPIWRFVLPAGACGVATAFGVCMPSVDRVGRHFPLVLAACADHADGCWPDAAPAFLHAAERAGLAALEGTLPATAIAERLAQPADPVGDLPGWPSCGALWWTNGAPLVRPCRREMPGLPDEDTFASMLSDGWSA
jgi:type VI secretion system protein ImpM